jgi:dGTPase
MDETRRDLERREECSLAPYALRSARAARPLRLDREGRLFDYRTEFQRDRDRILHARAFRRLRLKAEGGAPGRSERRRDRLTHTLEVAQMARTVARALSLNEDLTEAIALGHAVGSPPFGRDGARALDRLLVSLEEPLPGGFQTHLQSLRVVDLLEKRYDHPGLNLSHDVREGILKQEGGALRPSPAGGDRQPDGPAGRPARGDAAAKGRPSRRPPAPGSILAGIDTDPLEPGRAPSLEAQSVTIADRIASALGDLDDALRSGELDLANVEKIPLVRALLRRLGTRYPARSRGKLFMKANLLHRGLTHLLVTATIQRSRRTIRTWSRGAGFTDHESFLEARSALPADAIGMEARTHRLFDGLRGALATRLQSSAAAAAGTARARFILGSLFEAYRRDPRLLDDYVLLRFKEAAGGRFLRDLPPGAMETEISRRYHDAGLFLRLVADHLAGMTDTYAASEYVRLFGSAPPAGRGGDIP